MSPPLQIYKSLSTVGADPRVGPHVSPPSGIYTKKNLGDVSLNLLCSNLSNLTG